MQYLYQSYNAPCPICTHTANRLLYSVNAHQAANHFIQTIRPKDTTLNTVAQKITNLWGGNTASIINCAKCNFTFADPFIAGDNEFYNLLPHSTTQDDDYWKWEFEETLSSIKKLAANNPNLHLLEIGASTGGFVKRAAGVLNKENMLCLEHSEFGVESIKKAGIEAKSLNFQQLNNNADYQNRFDIVCLFQVLEHMDDLDNIFKTFNWVLKPGGHLFIGVPNGDKIKFNELNNALLDMPPNHIGRFNQGAFHFLANKFKFNLFRLAVEPYTPLDVVKTVMYYQSLQRLQLPPVANTAWFRIKQYIGIKYLWLQALLMHKKLGETLLVQFTKPD